MEEVLRIKNSENYFLIAMIFFQEFLPEVPLMTIIKDYWVFENTGSTLREDIITHDGSMNIFFVVKGSITVHGLGYSGQAPNYFALPIVGSPIKFSYRELKCVGMSLQPWANLTFFNQQKNFTIQCIGDISKCLNKEHLDVLNKLEYESKSNEQLIEVIKNISYFIFRDHELTDKSLKEVVNKIIEFKGEFSIAEICAALRLTKRGTELKFFKHVGTTPKFFLQKIRFHNFLTQALETHDMDLTKLALSAGYYDQSHLIRTCHKFTGLPPSKLVHALSNSTGLNKKLNFSF